MAAVCRCVRNFKLPFSFQVLKTLPITTRLREPCNFQKPPFSNHSQPFHTTSKRNGLMEFFDDEKNWGADEVKTGKSWSKDELRIKSNSDLHKLWYVLLKEYNMLLTMEHAANVECELFPSPERKDKVEESMQNLEEVVRERNKAYFMLETGETGERPWQWREDFMGLVRRYRKVEHIVPRKFGGSYFKKLGVPWYGKDLFEFQALYREKRCKELARERRLRRREVVGILRRFPDVDLDVLRQTYPDIDVDKALNRVKERIYINPPPLDEKE